MSSRLQTWFPFSIPIYRNAREWLARQMDRAGMHYRRHDNCFTGVEDFARAQALLDEQRKLNGAEHFDPIAPQIHPLFAKISAPSSNGASTGMVTACARCTHLIPRITPCALQKQLPQLVYFQQIASSCFPSSGSCAPRGLVAESKLFRKFGYGIACGAFAEKLKKNKFSSHR
jgi:hypothetical protein